jgi:4-hydroxybenzoyl-CoA thioesterase
MPVDQEAGDNIFSPPPGAFTVHKQIRFAHTDAIGIVYFPKFFDYFNSVIEDWYNDWLRIKFADLIMKNHWGTAIVRAESDFYIPCAMGETLDLTLIVERCGNSSISYLIIGHMNNRMHLRGRLTTVLISQETGRPLALPDDLRAGINRYMQLVPDGPHGQS